MASKRLLDNASLHGGDNFVGSLKFTELLHSMGDQELRREGASE